MSEKFTGDDAYLKLMGVRTVLAHHGGEVGRSNMDRRWRGDEWIGSAPFFETNDEIETAMRGIETEPKVARWMRPALEQLEAFQQAVSDRFSVFPEHPHLVDTSIPVNAVDEYAVTILGAAEPTGKEISFQKIVNYPNGGMWKTTKKAPKEYRHFLMQASPQTVEDWARLLTEIQKHDRLYIVRNHPVTFGSYRRVYARRTVKNGEGNGCLYDVPRRWLCIDIDGLELPLRLSYADPGKIVDWIMTEKMPPYFRGVSCVWNVSSSGGTVKASSANFHIFLFLDKPLASELIRNAIKDDPDKPGWLDLRIFVNSQPIFTAVPRIAAESVIQTDPMEGRRVGVWHGKREAADLSMLVEPYKTAADKADRERREKEEERAVKQRQRESWITRVHGAYSGEAGH